MFHISNIAKYNIDRLIDLLILIYIQWNLLIDFILLTFDIQNLNDSIQQTWAYILNFLGNILNCFKRYYMQGKVLQIG